MRRGVTLIEVLAIVVLVAFAGSILVVGISSRAITAQTNHFVMQWQALDRRARLMARLSARESTALQLAVTESAVRLVIARAQADPETFDMIYAPNGVETWLQAEASVINFDRRGCTPDYEFMIKANGSMRRWFVAGLTGWIEAADEEPQR